MSSMLNTWVTQSRATSHQPRSSPRLVAFSGVAICSAWAAGFRAAPAPLDVDRAAVDRERGFLHRFAHRGMRVAGAGNNLGGARSEERRVGKECGSTVRSRWV